MKKSRTCSCLVRSVHLNPMRAGLAPDLDVLGRYPWSGHAVLMGRGELPGQAVDEVLGGSQFIAQLRKHEALRDRLRSALAPEALPKRTGCQFGLTGEEVCRKGRNPAVVQARATL